MHETMDNQQASQELLWLACLIETEGSIGVQKGYSDKYLRLVPQITITNSDPAIIDKAIGILKTIPVGNHITSKEETPNRRKIWNIRIMGIKRNKPLLEKIIPYLVGEKKNKAQLLLKYCNERLEVQAERLNSYPNWLKKKIKGDELKSLHRAPKEWLVQFRESPRDYTPILKYLDTEKVYLVKRKI